jgi:stearoyl-CoA desaturase (delta-9 desaturase)
VQPPIAIPERFAHLPLPAADRGVDWIGFSPFLLVHVAPLAALWTGTRPVDWILCGVLYFVRTFGVMAGYHRYFSHRTFKTSRVFQFILAFLAETSGQKGVLWWAAHHRTTTSSPICPGTCTRRPSAASGTRTSAGSPSSRPRAPTTEVIRDLARFPELVWLNRHWMWPPLLSGAAVFLAFGWSGLFIGFFLSTVLTWHATFLVNSLSHVVGKRRFETGDTSRNHWLIAIFTMGEGWHNNHHHYMSSTRQGFYWWEIDLTYYVLRLLAVFGIVWDLRPVPPAIIAEGRAIDAAARR